MTTTAVRSPDATSSRIAPGPRGHLLLGVLPDARRDVLGLLLGTARRYGDVARYRLGPVTSHLITHPDGVRRVLQDHVENYTKDHFSYRLVSRVAGNGLLTSQGSFWLRQRRLAQPAFHRQRIAAMAEGMTRATAAMLERWDGLAARGEPVGMMEEMMRLTLTVVGDALLGASVGERAEVVGNAFNVLSEQTATRFRTFRLLPPVLPTRYDREYRAAARALRGTVMELITERRQGGAEDRGDLLSMFMLARDEETGEVMTDEQLCDEVLTMLVAGHETTAVTMSWVWALLHQHPHVEEKLHAELDAVLGGRLPTAGDVPRLGYTRMVVEEAMRLYPPAYVYSRAVKEDDVIGGFRIPGGTAIDISPYVTHRHPDFWERPEEFLPERFSPEAAARRPRYAYFPFSGGPRQCIGNGFAMMEAQLILATVAQRFRPRLAAGQMPTPEPLITLRPKGELTMNLERRGPATHAV